MSDTYYPRCPKCHECAVQILPQAGFVLPHNGGHLTPNYLPPNELRYGCRDCGAKFKLADVNWVRQ